MAEREGLTSTALILPTTLANFCRYHQRYQSLATERTCILPVFLENQIGHILVAVVVSQRPFGLSKQEFTFLGSTRTRHSLCSYVKGQKLVSVAEHLKPNSKLCTIGLKQ